MGEYQYWWQRMGLPQDQAEILETMASLHFASGLGGFDVEALAARLMPSLLERIKLDQEET